MNNFGETIKLFPVLIILSVVFEFITLASRLIMHMRSNRIQKHLHFPRVHHSYLGVVLVLISVWFGFKEPSYNYWLLVIGLALIISDLLHHILFLYLLRKYKYDIGMENHNKIHHKSLKK